MKQNKIIFLPLAVLLLSSCVNSQNNVLVSREEDSISKEEFATINNKWFDGTENRIVELSKIDETLNNSKEESSNTFSRRITRIHFVNDIFNDSVSSSTNLALSENIGKNIIFNGKTLLDLANTDENVELLKDTNNSMLICVPLKYYQKQINQEFIYLSFNDVSTSSIVKISNFELVLVNGKWNLDREFSFQTIEELEFIEKDGFNMKFKSYISLDPKVDLSKTSFDIGVCLVNKNSYEDSEYASILNFVKNNKSGPETYIKYPYSSRIFTVVLDTAEEKMYEYKVTAKIDKENYRDDLIPVSYLCINNKDYYSTKTDFCCSVYNELVKLEVNRFDYPDVFTELFVATLDSGEKTYELLDNSINKALLTLTYDQNGYYKIKANNNINQFVINGKTYNRHLSAGETIYLCVFNETALFQTKPLTPKFGFSEPNIEIWSDLNSSVSNTYDNNALIHSEFNSKTARIWVSASFLIDSAWPEIGLVDPVGIKTKPLTKFEDYATYDIKFKESSIEALQNTIKAYRNAGVEDINLLVNGFVYSYTDQFFYAAGNQTTPSQFKSWYECHVAGSDLPTDRKGVFIKKENNLDAYTRWINGNKDFYKLIFNTFDIDFVECLNEINLNPCSYSMEYFENYLPGISNPYPTVELQRYYRDQIIEYTMEYQKIINDAVKESSRKNIRVMTPAIALVADWLNLPKNYTQGQVSQIRDAGDFIEKSYEYIESKKGRVSDYFQVINLHPYLFEGYITGQNDNCLYNENGSFNTNYPDDWKASLDDIHAISVAHNDDFIPMFFTEFGFTDYEGINETGYYPGHNKIGYGDSDIIPNAINSLLPIAKTLPYCYTLQWFRIYSFSNKYEVEIQTNIADTDYAAFNKFVNEMYAMRCDRVTVIGSSGGKFIASGIIEFDALNFVTQTINKKTVCSATYNGHTFTIKNLSDAGEPNFGFISKNFTVKSWGYPLYQQFTGKTDTSSLEIMISKLTK